MLIRKRDTDIILRAPASWEKLRGRTVLVTGATGRIGVFFVAALLEANRAMGLGIHVLGLTRNREKIGEYYPVVPDGLTLLEQDVTVPVTWEGKINYIIHTAGLASPMDFTHRPIETMWGHVQGTKNVLDLAVSCKAEKVLYVSTIETYGTWTREEGIRETDMGPLEHTNARACYPEAKRLCETMLACYKAEKDVDYAIARLSHTFGPGISLTDGRAFAEFIRDVVNGEDIVLQSDGSAVRTYTYVADAVAAMMLVLLNGTETIYNVAAVENQISIRDLAYLLAGMDPKKKVQVRFRLPEGKKLLYLPFKLGILNTDRICALGWKPEVGTEEAFRRTLESFLDTEDCDGDRQ